jgi:hypothetical protein
MTKVVEFESIEPMETIQTSLDYQMRENPIGETRKDAQKQAHQDRSQGDRPFPLSDISNGGSGCTTDALSGNLS